AVLAAANADAQVPPPPPPSPLIYEAPAAADIRSFSPPDNSFRADFPGEPKVTEKESGDLKIRTFRVYRKGSNSVIEINEFSRDISAEDGAVFGLIREGFLKKRDVQITSEKDIELDGYLGKEFVIDDGYVHRVVRVFVADRRTYEIHSDATNWHILTKYNPEVVAKFEEDTARFFKSFRLAKSKP
ncbi:MAG: hypothetical protein ABI857_11570, partial [Acidobacteriota bacterium]